MALQWLTDGDWQSFRFGDDLKVYDDGGCESRSAAYADGRDDGSFPDDCAGVFLTRFELWSL
jgi:hypothetical protein